MTRLYQKFGPFLATPTQMASSGEMQTYRALSRWVAIILVLIAGGFGVLAAAKGDVLLTIAMALLVLTNVAHLAFDPAARPENLARSLEASRQVSAAGS